MSPALFEELLCLVAPHIPKKETKLRQPISPSERLCVTLQYLVTGDAFVTIGASYNETNGNKSNNTRDLQCTLESFAREQIY